MATETVLRIIQDATSALQRGDLSKALELCDEATRLDPSIPEPYQIRGIILSRQGDLESAGTSFKCAHEVAPDLSKHAYNFAINLRDRGLLSEAMEMAIRAMKCHGTNAGAKVLYLELTGEEAPGQSETANGPKENEPRSGFDRQEHLLPFMYGMERAWNGIGLFFIAIGCVLAAMMFVHLPMGPTAGKVAKGQLPDIGLRGDPVSIFVTYLFIVSSICTFMWMLTDVIDRKRKFSWLIPILACGVVGMNVLPLSLYFFVGRKMEP